MINKMSYKNVRLLLFTLGLSHQFCSLLHSQELKKSQNSKKEIPVVRINGALPENAESLFSSQYSSIAEADLKKRQSTYKSLGDALQYEAGVTSSSFAPGASRPVIRGQSGDRVRVLENGVGVGDLSSTSDDHSVSTDIFNKESIEIIRGPAALLYGSSAVGGVVNLQDSAIAEQAIGKEFKADIDLQRSNPTQDLYAGAVKLEGEENSINWHFSTSYTNTGNIKIPGNQDSDFLLAEEELEHQEDEEHSDEEEGRSEEEEVRGKVPNSDLLQKNITLGVSKTTNYGFFGISLRHYNNNYGIPGHGHEEGHEDESGDEVEEALEDVILSGSEEEPDVAIDMEQTRFALRGASEDPSDFIKKIKYNLQLSDYEHKELEGSEVGTRFTNKGTEGRVEVDHATIGELFDGTVGFQLRADDFDAQGEESYVPGNKQFEPAVFILENIDFSDSLSLQSGLRYEFRNINPREGNTRSFTPVSFSTGLKWNDENSGLKAGLVGGLSQRAPSAIELYANGGHVATRTFEIGNTGLGKEKSINGEFYVEKDFGFLQTKSNAFIQDYSDYIYLNPTGQMEDDLPVFQYEESGARIYGFEFTNIVPIIDSYAQKLLLRGQLDLVRGTNTDLNSPLPRITPVRTLVALDYSYDFFSTSVEAQFVETQHKTADNELPTLGYTLLNAYTSFTLPNQMRSSSVALANPEVYFSITNLLNKEVRNHTSFTKDFFPQMGRAFMGGVRLQF
jgi:iron complex outermembrane recepter protein